MSKLFAVALSSLGLLVYIGLEISIFRSSATEPHQTIEIQSNEVADRKASESEAQDNPEPWLNMSGSDREFMPSTKMAMGTDPEALRGLAAVLASRPNAPPPIIWVTDNLLLQPETE